MTVKFLIRPATSDDIPRMHEVRISVKENRLSDPNRISFAEYENFMKTTGKSWVCEAGNTLCGFAVIDLEQKNIWALFVHPQFEQQGIGRLLQKQMLDWYFNLHEQSIWLSTAPGTRAEKFYKLSGWKHTGETKTGELYFEMHKTEWEQATEK